MFVYEFSFLYGSPYVCVSFLQRKSVKKLNVHFIRFHCKAHTHVLVDKRENKKHCPCPFNAWTYWVIEKKWRGKKKKRKINNRFLGTKAFLAFFLHYSVVGWHFLYLLSHLSEKTYETKRTEEITHAVHRYPVGQFFSTFVVQVIFFNCMSYRNVWSIFSLYSL